MKHICESSALVDLEKWDKEFITLLQAENEYLPQSSVLYIKAIKAL